MVLPVEVFVISYWDPSNAWRNYVKGLEGSIVVPEKEVFVGEGHSHGY